VAAKTYSLELKKPVGLVFAQKSEGGLGEACGLPDHWPPLPQPLSRSPGQ